ncbi:MAG: hypothetical protein K2Q24_00070 [Chitinophagaceae bacterium]|jgi:hypothetical protein|nr:hypothetical protein [Chitinophagaceae bacterium]
MAELVIKTKNKKEEKVVKAFLESLEIEYLTEVQEEQALYKAMQKGKKSKTLTAKEKVSFVKKLKSAK